MDFGLHEILITHQDGILVYANDEFIELPFYSRNFSGRGGRGDTCLGAYVAKRLTDPAPEAARWAAALTSLKMETPGPFRGQIGEVAQLIDNKYR